jgi:hypothetical protein
MLKINAAPLPVLLFGTVVRVSARQSPSIKVSPDIEQNRDPLTSVRGSVLAQSPTSEPLKICWPASEDLKP